MQPVQVVKEYAHDPAAFCQGLVFHNGKLIEGTGRYNESRLRQVDLDTGNVEIEVKLRDDIFGEGVTVFQDQILQLTWKNNQLLVYDAATLKFKGVVRYPQIDPTLREGWGITHDSQSLIISDGTSRLRFCDPKTYRVSRKLTVRNGRRAQTHLNELEFVDGYILANVWYEDKIARIDPGSGQIVDWLDLRQLKPGSVRWDKEAVLNGIAWDESSRRLFVTGKNWPKLFEIKIPPPAN